MLDFDINELEFHYKFYEQYRYNQNLLYFYTIVGFDLLKMSDIMILEFYVQINKKKSNIIDKLNLKKTSKEQIGFFIKEICKNGYLILGQQKYSIKEMITKLTIDDPYSIDYCVDVIEHKYYYCRC